MSRARGLVGAGVALVLLAGCGEVSGAAGGSAGAGGPVVSVVASTDVWGDVVAQVAGDLAQERVRITSIIDDPAADPHSYESTPAGAAAVAGAQLVVYNGGGYDDWMQQLVESAGGDRKVINVAELSGLAG
jgi:zinc/manganese transport system substrate-binding protein